MIVLFFNALSLIILARVIFSFIGYNYGGIYDFVFLWSEKILRPIRKILPPSSRIDWSPLVALLIFDIGKKLLNPLIFYIANGRSDLIPPLLFYVLVSVISSVTVFLTILLTVRVINDIIRGDNYAFTAFINSVTDPLVQKIKNILPHGYKTYCVWISLAALILLQMLFNNILRPS